MLRAAAVTIALAGSTSAQLYPDHEFPSSWDTSHITSVDVDALDRTCYGNAACGMPGIWQCRKPGQVAITFDDGPFEFTEMIKRQFNDYGYNATFFITGKNRGRRIDDFETGYPRLIQDMIHEGHQVASHTWTHRNLENSTFDWDIRSEMLDNEHALAKILDGYVPTYMRPPYAVCGQRCSRVLSELGYKVIMFNIDTTDYKYNDEVAIEKAIARFDGALDANGPGSYIVLSHDQEWTAKKLVPSMLKQVQQKGYEAVTVGECLNDPIGNWYRQAPVTHAAGEEARPEEDNSDRKSRNKWRNDPADMQRNVHLPEAEERLLFYDKEIERNGVDEDEQWTPPSNGLQWRKDPKTKWSDVRRRQKVYPPDTFEKNGRKALKDYLTPGDKVRNVRLPLNEEYSKWFAKEVDKMRNRGKSKGQGRGRSSGGIEKREPRDPQFDTLADWQSQQDFRKDAPLILPDHGRTPDWEVSEANGEYDLYLKQPHRDYDDRTIGQTKKTKREVGSECLASKSGCAHSPTEEDRRHIRRGEVPDENDRDRSRECSEDGNDEQNCPDSWQDWH